MTLYSISCELCWLQCCMYKLHIPVTLLPETIQSCINPFACVCLYHIWNIEILLKKNNRFVLLYRCTIGYTDNHPKNPLVVVESGSGGLKEFSAFFGGGSHQGCVLYGLARVVSCTDTYILSSLSMIALQ